MFANNSRAFRMSSGAGTGTKEIRFPSSPTLPEPRTFTGTTRRNRRFAVFTLCASAYFRKAAVTIVSTTSLEYLPAATFAYRLELCHRNAGPREFLRTLADLVKGQTLGRRRYLRQQ